MAGLCTVPIPVDSQNKPLPTNSVEHGTLTFASYFHDGLVDIPMFSHRVIIYDDNVRSNVKFEDGNKEKHFLNEQSALEFAYSTVASMTGEPGRIMKSSNGAGTAVSRHMVGNEKSAAQRKLLLVDVVFLFPGQAMPVFQ